MNLLIQGKLPILFALKYSIGARTQCVSRMSKCCVYVRQFALRILLIILGQLVYILETSYWKIDPTGRSSELIMYLLYYILQPVLMSSVWTLTS